MISRHAIPLALSYVLRDGAATKCAKFLLPDLH
jgi:hypothetical protein